MCLFCSLPFLWRYATSPYRAVGNNKPGDSSLVATNLATTLVAVASDVLSSRTLKRDLRLYKPALQL